MNIVLILFSLLLISFAQLYSEEIEMTQLSPRNKIHTDFCTTPLGKTLIESLNHIGENRLGITPIAIPKQTIVLFNAMIAQAEQCIHNKEVIEPDDLDKITKIAKELFNTAPPLVRKALRKSYDKLDLQDARNLIMLCLTEKTSL